jgi:polyphenol oxidase
VVRKNVKTLSTDELNQLKTAFAAVRARTASDPGDPTGWLNQANIHDRFCNTDDPNVEVHFSWWFLPWHRAYLYYFEKILQDAANDGTLALPYWDWTVDRNIPAAFFGDGNPLNDPSRDRTADDTVPAQPVQVAGLLNLSDFALFGGDAVPFQSAGQLESGPHNYVHSWVGGDMGQFGTAARDPLFWLHHANVDRVWEKWARRPEHQNPTNPDWLNRRFTFFDPKGSPTDLLVGQTLDVVQGLNYRYDDVPETLIGVLPAQVDAKPITTETLPLPEGLKQKLTALAVPAVVPRQAVLRIEGVELPGKEPLHVRVFVNKEANAATSTDDPSFVGSFTFLPHVPGKGHRKAHPPVAAVLAVPPKALKLIQDQGKMRLTLVPMKIDESGPAETPLKAAKFSLGVHG